MESSLNQAITLAKAGDKAAARRLLRRFVAEHPQNEAAWGWLAYCAETKTERRQALERVLEINPANRRARDTLKKMRPTPAPARSTPAKRRKSPAKTKDKSKRRGCGRTFVIIMLLLIILVCLSSLGTNDSGNDGKDREREPSTLEAWSACKEFVRQDLKAPSTAKFPTFDKNFVQEHDNNNWRVSAWVDSENAFGATLRAHFICVLRYENQEWHLKDILIE